mgnify:CR=1 FL=1
MTETFNIAGYTRISVDDELDRDNVSIENQKAIIEDFVKTQFPGSSLTFFEDRDRSGYTFEQREGYQKMREGLMSHKYDILIIKDFSRFSRRNSRGLVELEDLRDAGVRIISIGDGIDFPNDDDWLKIQFQFLVNEMPVTDTSRKVRNVIKRRQADGKWLCAAPYGYIINNQQQFEIVPTEADIVRRIYDHYNNDGWGYKKIANYLTEQGVPTPRMSEQMRKQAEGNVLVPYRGAMAFEEMRLHVDRSGKQPKAFMLTAGHLAMARARAQFSCNFFACAGIRVQDNTFFKSIEEGVKAALESKAEIVVVCASDDDYAEAAPKVKELLGGKAILVVAGAPACAPELEAQGIKNFINVKSNVLETLKFYLKEMGI